MLRKIWVQKSRMLSNYCVTLFYTNNKDYQIVIVRDYSQKVTLGVFSKNLENVLNELNLSINDYQ